MSFVSRRYRSASPLLSLLLLCPATRIEGATILPIPPVGQQTRVWCWVAVGEMVFRYFEVPNVNPAGNYQCGIIGLLAAGTRWYQCAFSCELCNVPAGNAQGVINMLRNYPKKAADATGQAVPKITVDYRELPLTTKEVMDAINANAPIIAGISPSGRPPDAITSPHVALITGYRIAGNTLEMKVNDPFPYTNWKWNPYVRLGAGQSEHGTYWVRHGAFAKELAWKETFIVKKAGQIRPQMGWSCCMPSGKCGPFYDQPALPLGSPCTCQRGNPNASGTVCK